MKILKLAQKSAWNRRLSLLLTVVSIAISMSLLLGVDKIRKDAKRTFMNTISQTDLIVGARSGPANLLLYSVFHIGNASNNIQWNTFKKISQHANVDWAVPISLGDSHRGFRVIGTTPALFEHYRFAEDQSLSFQTGNPFVQVYDAVVGADVARTLGYSLDQSIVLSHGLVAAGFSDHQDKPFRITGVLAKTGTPIDRSVLVSLAGIEAIHVDWQLGSRSVLRLNAEQAAKADLTPRSITAMLVGLKKRLHTFRLQRELNEFKAEPLLAIIPGATLAELWQTVSSFESVLLVISVFVLVAGMIGMLTMLLSTLNERRREMAVLRAVGAHPSHIIQLFVLEGLFIAVLATGLGLALLYGLLWLLKPWLLANYGVGFSLSPPDAQQWAIAGLVIILSMLFSLIPGFIAFKRSLQDGLTIRI